MAKRKLIGVKQKVYARVHMDVLEKYPQVIEAISEGDLERIQKRCEEILLNEEAKAAHPIAIDLLRLCITLLVVEAENPFA